MVAGELVALDGQALRRALAKLEHLETVEKNGGRLETRRYWHPDEVEWFARAVRGHWGLDVPLGEEASRVRRGHALENPATSRRRALNLLRRDQTCRRDIAGKRLNAAWKHDYLIKLLAL